MRSLLIIIACCLCAFVYKPCCTRRIKRHCHISTQQCRLRYNWEQYFQFTKNEAREKERERGPNVRRSNRERQFSASLNLVCVCMRSIFITAIGNCIAYRYSQLWHCNSMNYCQFCFLFAFRWLCAHYARFNRERFFFVFLTHCRFDRSLFVIVASLPLLYNYWSNSNTQFFSCICSNLVFKHRKKIVLKRGST